MVMIFGLFFMSESHFFAAVVFHGTYAWVGSGTGVIYDPFGDNPLPAWSLKGSNAC